ncbi:hypothetical protein [Nonomuraea salmonea]
MNALYYAHLNLEMRKAAVPESPVTADETEPLDTTPPTSEGSGEQQQDGRADPLRPPRDTAGSSRAASLTDTSVT